MGHAGKHIIDPETGLCEICDKGAIQEVHQGKRPGKHVFYSGSEDRFTNRSSPDETPRAKEGYVEDIYDEPTPRYVRRSLYPAPSARTRRVIYEQPLEQPIVVRRKVIRDDITPREDVIVRRKSALRSKIYYHVDKEGQMIHKSRTPTPEPSRRYVIQTVQPPPARRVRVVRRQIHTPPPPASERWYSGPRRQINSDTEVIQRQQRMRHNEIYDPPPSPIKPELYHIETPFNHEHQQRSDSPMYISQDNVTPSPKTIYQGDRNPRQNRVQPLSKPPIRNQSEPKIVKRVYRKLPPGKNNPPNEEYIPNENHPRSGRKPVKNYQTPKQHHSLPPLRNRDNQNSESAKSPTIYYIRSVDDYE